MVFLKLNTARRLRLYWRYARPERSIFSIMCSANVDMAMKTLFKEGKITKGGSYKDGPYFTLVDDERKIVDSMAEDICLFTRLLSSNRLHSASKQELRNDLIKGDDKYPTTIANTTTFLQYHNLMNKNMQSEKQRERRSEASFAPNDDEGDELATNVLKRVSATCRQWKDGKCAFKKKHTWK